jgi:hypothetical protein
MDCEFVRTAEATKRGEPIWRCANGDCSNRCKGERPANCNQCRANGSTPRPTEFAEIPCTNRGPIELIEIAACCNGTALVEFANCERGRCSVRGVDKSVACYGCSERTT